MTHGDDPTSEPPAWWPEGAKASMNPPQRSEVTEDEVAAWLADLADLRKRTVAQQVELDADLQRQIAEIRQAAEEWKERQK